MAINRITHYGYDDQDLRDRVRDPMFGPPDNDRRMRQLAVHASSQLAWLQYRLDTLPETLVRLRAELESVRGQIQAVVAAGTRPVPSSRRHPIHHNELLSALQAREDGLLEDIQTLTDMLASRLGSTPYDYYQRLLDDMHTEEGQVVF